MNDEPSIFRFDHHGPKKESARSESKKDSTEEERKKRHSIGLGISPRVRGGQPLIGGPSLTELQSFLDDMNSIRSPEPLPKTQKAEETFPSEPPLSYLEEVENETRKNNPENAHTQTGKGPHFIMEAKSYPSSSEKASSPPPSEPEKRPESEERTSPHAPFLQERPASAHARPHSVVRSGENESDESVTAHPDESLSPKPPAEVTPEDRERSAESVDDVAEPDRSSLPSTERLMVAMELTKSYVKGNLRIPVLRGVNLGVRPQEFLAIVGQSGSGKSTLLHLMATLDAPDGGSIHFDGQRIDNLSSGQRDLLRNEFIGMIFQFYHLLPELTTLENVLSPLMIRHGVLSYMTQRRKFVHRGEELLERVGLAHRAKHKPRELSGGEMQRAAIARSLIAQPQILLADEPTGNLDSESAREILDLLRTLNREQELTIVMVTHDLSIAHQADRILRLVDGRIQHDASPE